MEFLAFPRGGGPTFSTKSIPCVFITKHVNTNNLLFYYRTAPKRGEKMNQLYEKRLMMHMAPAQQQQQQTYSRSSVYMSAVRNHVTVRNLEKEFDVENEDSYNSNNGENFKSPVKVLDNEEHRSQSRQLTSVVAMWSSSSSPTKASPVKDVYSDRFIPFRQGNNWETKFPMISVSILLHFSLFKCDSITNETKY